MMMQLRVSTSHDEQARLDALAAYDILDTPPERAFDSITFLASEIASAPIASISFVDAQRVWSKSRHGLEAGEVPRNVAFCDYAIRRDDVFVVADAARDDRFADNPLVTGPPHVRTVAAVPLITRDGFRLGALCVATDDVTPLDETILEHLKTLASLVVDELDLRLSLRAVEQARVRAHAVNETNSALLATMSRDLRKPIKGVLAMAAALGHTPLSSGQRQMLEMLRREGDQQLTAINHILDVSTAEAAAVELRQSEFDLAALIDTVRDLHQGDADARGLTLRACVQPQAHGWYRGDLGRIHQVLSCLISNALKFTDVGGVDVGVSVREGVDGSHRDILFTVHDTGVGLDGRSQADLFAPLSQWGASPSKLDGRSGGLHMCQHLAGLMGGWIDADSDPGRGSTVRVMLPLEHVPSWPRPHALDAITPDCAVEGTASGDDGGSPCWR